MSELIHGIYVASQGITTTLAVTAAALIMGLILGLIIALAKMSKHKILKWPASIYVEVLRGTPLFVQLLILAFGLPMFVKQISNGTLSFNWNPIVFAGVIACGVNSSAYMAEIIRSGLQAIDKGQTEAARSLGMTHVQNMRYIIIPQAFRIILPAMGNEFVTLIKETSILSFVGIVEITREGILWASRDFTAFAAYLGVAFVYLCLTVPLSRLVAYTERRMAESDRSA